MAVVSEISICPRPASRRFPTTFSIRSLPIAKIPHISVSVFGNSMRRGKRGIGRFAKAAPPKREPLSLREPSRRRGVAAHVAGAPREPRSRAPPYSGWRVGAFENSLPPAARRPPSVAGCPPRAARYIA
jgi:hypothetical protein